MNRHASIRAILVVAAALLCSAAAEAAQIEVTIFLPSGATPVIKYVKDTTTTYALYEIHGTFPYYELRLTNFDARVTLNLQQITTSFVPRSVITNLRTSTLTVSYQDSEGPQLDIIDPGGAFDVAHDEDTSIIPICARLYGY